MEAFESFVALAMETEGLVVSGAVKFPVKRPTKKQSHPEEQTHGYEVDLVGANRDKLVLATVKSFFGSTGVNANDVEKASGYKLLNDKVIRKGVLKEACKRYGYARKQVEIRLYIGKIYGRTDETQAKHLKQISAWVKKQRLGGTTMTVVPLEETVAKVRKVALLRQYRDDPALVAVKVLSEAGQLRDDLPEPL